MVATLARRLSRGLRDAHRSSEARLRSNSGPPNSFYRFSSIDFRRLQIPLDVGDFRLLDRQVVDVLLAMPNAIGSCAAW